MKAWIGALSLLLAVQLVLVGALWATLGQGPAQKTSALAAVAKNKVQRIRITGAKKRTVALVRHKNAWQLPAAGNFPADKPAVSELLAALTDDAARLPVARSKQARRRLHVARNGFRAQVVLNDGRQRKTRVYIGGAAGPGRVYARSGKSDDIYTLKLTRSSVSDKPSDWFDTSIPAVSTAHIKRIQLARFALERKHNGWRVKPAQGQAQKPAPGKAATLANRLARPQFTDVTRGGPPQAKPDYRYAIHTDRGKTVHYRYYAAGNNHGALFVRDDQPWRYRVAPEALAKLEKTDARSLIAKAPAQKPGPPAKPLMGKAHAKPPTPSPGTNG